MQYRFEQRNYLDCQGWTKWVSTSTPGFTAITTNFSNNCTNFSQLCWMSLLSTHNTTSSQPQDDNMICRRAARNLCWEILPMMSKFWAWIDLWCLTNGHESEAKHESKVEDLCTEKPFLIYYHNQLAPSCTSVCSRWEYWRWQHPLYCHWNPKNANLI